MNSKLLRLCVALMLVLLASAGRADSFANLYVFGDSLADTGNLAALPDFSFLQLDPYDDGFSNGPRAVEVLGQQLGLATEPSLHLLGAAVGTNYAVAGARAAGTAPIDLSTQISAFLLNNTGIAPADALYVLIVGANDIRDARDAPDDVAAIRIVRRATAGVRQAVQRLLAAGARAVLLTNAPDIGRIPETLILAATTGDTTLVERATRLSRLFNNLLAERLTELETVTGIDLVIFDLFRFVAAVSHDGTALGFTNTTDPCFSSLTFTYDPECENGANFDQFLYFDELHPTAALHARVGLAMRALVPGPLAP